MNPLRLQLPATSANLGPGFDALGLALDLYLTVEACEAAEFRIEATGHNVAEVASLSGNLLLETYQELLGPRVQPLALTIQNAIPLGMGLGSSAAAILAGVMLANHFGELGLDAQQVLAEACRREGHPDNVAACLLGGLTVSSIEASSAASRVNSATLGQRLPWRLLLALPTASLATAEARALLPGTCSREDAVSNLQATALLVSAFALDRPDLLRAATRDRLHQPFRSTACPLLPALLPLAGHAGVYSVTLSGAGPAVLLIVDPAAPLEPLLSLVHRTANSPGLTLVETRIGAGAQSSPGR